MEYTAQRCLNARRKPLATCIAALFSLSTPAAMAATTWTVDTCDGGSSAGNLNTYSGNLRFAVAHAALGGGDTVDMTLLKCGVISLSTGALNISQKDLTLKGPGIDKLVITGLYYDRVLNHTGSGSLYLESLSIVEGSVNATGVDARGGCIYSAGSVIADHVRISYCTARTDRSSKGGGIFTNGSLTLWQSSLAYNSVSSSSPPGALDDAKGGGAFASGGLTALYSTISNNSALGLGGGYAGGLFVEQSAVNVSGTTISGNHASTGIGGLWVAGNGSGSTIIQNSTISGNSTGGETGGVYVNSGIVNIVFSTIAFNTAASQNGHSPGLDLGAFFGPIKVVLQSSLIANNLDTSTSTNNDLTTVGVDASHTVTFSGAKNLVGATSVTSLPPMTTTGVCPLLGPLRDNGGPTLTHALLSHSPGLDQGDAGSFWFDQRGFPRVSGSAADIGAYEVAQNDIIFNSSFEGCQ